MPATVLIRPIPAAQPGVDTTAAISNPATSDVRIRSIPKAKVEIITDSRANAESVAPACARFPAVQGSVARAIAVAWLYADRARLPPETAEPLAILVEEWVLNLIEHGGAAASSQIVLRIDRRGDGVRVTISDEGIHFDPRDVEMEGPNGDRGGGAGIALMQAWSRIVDYRRRGGRNRLVLEIG